MLALFAPFRRVFSVLIFKAVSNCTLQGIARFSSSELKFSPLSKFGPRNNGNGNGNGDDDTEDYLYTILTDKKHRHGRCNHSEYWVDYESEEEEEMEIEAGVAQQRIKRDALKICSILKDGVENYSAFEQRLAPFISKLSAQLVCRVMGYCDSRLALPAISFFFWAQRQPGYSHNSATFDAVIQFAAKTRDFQLLSMLLKECKRWGFSFTPKSFSFVVDEAGTVKSHMVRALLRSIHKVNGWNRRGKNRDAFDALLSALCNANRFDAALQVLRGMVPAGFCLTAHTYNILVAALCREGRLEDAKLLIEEMKDKGSCPTTITYNRLLKAYIEENRLREASDLVHSMTETGCTADSFTYTQLINVACRSRLPFVGLKLLRKVEYSGFKPMPDAYHALVKCFESVSQFDEADKLIREMVEKGYDKTTGF